MAVINQTGNALTGSTGTGSFVGSTSPTINTPILTDTNGITALTIGTTASAVNYIQIFNRATGARPYLSLAGTDSSIGLLLNMKGTGNCQIASSNTAPITFASGTGQQHTTTFSFADTAASRVVTFPDSDFTIAPTVSPVFTTPTLGVATATSINFGGNALNNYTEGTLSFSPTITFATPGDLSVVYTQQLGSYTRIGRMVWISVRVDFTPTFTTASGQFRIGSLPFTSSSSGPVYNLSFFASGSTGFSYGASATMVQASVAQGVTYIGLTSMGSSIASISISASNFTSGVAQTFRLSGWYMV